MKAWIIFLILLFELSNASGGWFKKPPSTASTESLIVSSAEAVNKQVPMMVDEGTRLDRVVPGPGLLATYQYTFIKVRRIDADPRLLSGDFSKDLRNKVCANEKLYIFLKHGVTLAYSYSSNDGVTLGTINVTPKDCGF